jgi:hypothetical protein
LHENEGRDAGDQHHAQISKGPIHQKIDFESLLFQPIPMHPNLPISHEDKGRHAGERDHGHIGQQ